MTPPPPARPFPAAASPPLPWLALCLALVAGLAAPSCAPAAPAGEPAGGGAELGAVAFPTSADGEAQAHFERGVAAMHSFWYPEAEEEFRRARELDPGFAMAHWGEAMSHNHPVWDQVDVDAARAVLEELGPTPEERLAKAPTERERAYLEAAEALFFGAGDKPARDSAYAGAMARVAERFPDDPEAKILHALAIQGVVYGGVEEARRFPLLMESAAILEELFDDHPRHPGVLHYLIHAYDDPVHAPLGLRAAETYAEVAPAAPHALHMPSHIFVQRGRWADAVASNQSAWEASVGWVEERDLDPSHRDFHSLDWLLYAELQRGTWEDGRDTLETVRRADAESDAGRVSWYRSDMEARWVIERLGSSGAAGAPGAGPGAGIDPPPEAVLGSERSAAGPWLAVALAAHRAGDGERARQAADRLAEISAREDGDDPLGSPVAVMAAAADGVALLAAGRTDDGLAALAEAARMEERLDPPSGPPDTVKPAHELHAEMLLAHDRPQEAAEQLEVALRRTPGRAAALLAAARAAAATGDAGAARRHYRAYLDVRRDADPGVPGLAEAQRAVASP